MEDWRKTQYRLGPKRDPLNDPMTGENLWLGVFLPLLVGGAFFGGIALLLYWLVTL